MLGVGGCKRLNVVLAGIFQVCIGGGALAEAHRSAGGLLVQWPVGGRGVAKVHGAGGWGTPRDCASLRCTGWKMVGEECWLVDVGGAGHWAR